MVARTSMPRSCHSATAAVLVSTTALNCMLRKPACRAWAKTASPSARPTPRRPWAGYTMKLAVAVCAAPPPWLGPVTAVPRTRSGSAGSTATKVRRPRGPGIQIARALSSGRSRSHENVSPAATICAMNAQIAGQSASVASRTSTTGAHDVVAVGLEHRDDRVAMVALQLDDAVLGRPAHAAALLQATGELLEPGVVERDVADGGHGLAAPAGGLPAHLDPPAGLAPRLQARVARLAQVAVVAGPHHTRHPADRSAPPAARRSIGSAPMAPSEKPQVDVPADTPPSYQLEIEDLEVGDGDEAGAGRIVSVHYVGVSWSTGQEFDASWDRGDTFKFGLGKGQVIQGWDQGVAGMRVGGRRRITIPPMLGYGKRGAGGVIGPDETLVFVVDLVGVR